MRKVKITLKDKDGAPIVDEATARRIILWHVANDHPNKKPENVHIKKIDNNGNYTFTI